MKSVSAVFLACGILVAQDERELETIVVNRINIAPPRPSPERGQGVGIVVGTLTAEGRSFAGFGRTSLDGDEKPNAQTIFEIGSISKVFTALLLADMVERGKLNMDDPVGKYLPETVTVPAYDGKQITLADLVTHTSGLPLMPSNLGATSLDNPYAAYSPARLYDFLSGYTLKRARAEHTSIRTSAEACSVTSWLAKLE
jgi:serine-type D-Ala-D-Ala carboxypeptidase/endopeptidase